MAFAADSSGKFAVDGIGQRSCSDFTSSMDADKDAARLFVGWTEGFLTGVNVYQKDTFDITPFQPIELTLLKLRKYCSVNPDQKFVNALGRLIASYAPGKIAESSELLRFDVEGNAVFIYRETLKRVTGVLISRDISPENPDPGKVSTYLSDYQREEALPITGLPDIQTLNRMFP